MADELVDELFDEAVDGTVARPTATVVGGGPAGLIAAEMLAADGFAVTVFDHKPSVGRKFLLAGRGGLNLTHSEPIDRFIGRYDAGNWLTPFIGRFAPDDLRAWCEGLGEPTTVGSSGRVFPASFRATPLLRAWIARLVEHGVVFETRQRWVGWSDDGANLFEGVGGVRRAVASDVTVMALGGASWPRVGADGGWVPAFEAAGFDVVPLRASNAGVVVDWTAGFADRFAGQPLKGVTVTAGPETVRGDVVVTASGLEGGPVYGAGRAVRAALDTSSGATIAIDLQPDRTVEQLASRLGRRRAKDSVSNWLRRSIGLQPVAINLLREITGNRLPADPDAIARLVKRAIVPIRGLAPIDRAISTAGGVARHELDADLMVRRRPGTFLAGEMIDWEAPTGGYLLQASFSTGVAAAQGASKWSRGERETSRSLAGDDG
jgi:hypothetical protein